MARLPVTGTGDQNVWGDILNEYLLVGHNSDGTIKPKLPSLIIAASDASTRSKSNADYTCTGSNDGSTINTAIAALPSSGGVLAFTEGTFSLNAASITLRSNIHLLGVVDGTLWQLVNSANGRMISSTSTLSNIVFEGITFDYNGANQSDGAARDDRSGLFLSNITNFKFLRCTSKNCRHGASLRMSGMTNVLIQGCNFKDNGVTGAAYIGDHSFCGDSTFYRVIGNYYDTANDTGTAQDGVTYSTVMGNIYKNNVLGVSVAASTSAPSKYNTVVGNVIEGQGATLASTGIKVSKFGSAVGTNMTQVTLSGNVVRNCDRGMWLEEVDRLVVANNVVSDCAGSNNQLILISTVGTINDISIQGNMLYNTTNRGISFSSGTTNNLTAQNNQFISCTTPVGGTIPGTAVFRHNRGYVTEASGTATVANATTSIAVTHGLAATPSANHISVTPTNSLGSAAKFWISSVGATTFTINTNVDPGATTATFAWRAAIY